MSRTCVEQSQLGTSVILPDFILPSRVNQHWEYSGIDSYENCLDKTHFKQYPHEISYQYNSRGFRDQEWPDSLEELKTAIWCVGDSFTVGLGSPVEHTWPWLLQQQTDQRVINLAMDGASNNWISRRIALVQKEINPAHIVVMWSYLTRRELDLETTQNIKWNKFYQNIQDPLWPACETISKFKQLPEYIQQEINSIHGGIPPVSDECRRCWHLAKDTDADDLNNTINCIDLVNRASTDTKILHSFIPDFCENSAEIFQYLKTQQINFVPEFARLDLARDGHHFDLITAQWIVDQITNDLALQD